MSLNKILSISLRPLKLDDIIGQDDIVNTIKTQFKSGRVPHFFLISGVTGSGKTTLARIIAMMLNNITEEKLHKYDIKEINASDKNGIDDIREIISTIGYKPMAPSIAKVIILDEAHQLTTQAQNALLKVTEDTPSSSYIIFCTNNDTKILQTLKRRAYIIRTHEIDDTSIHNLLIMAKERIGFTGDIMELENMLIENDVRSPGLILQSAEKFFNNSNVSIESTNSTTIDTKKLCNLISKGDWTSCLPILKLVKKEDIIMIRMCLLGYLKTILLNNPEKSLKIAKAIMHINPVNKFDDDLPTFLSSLCIACDAIKIKIKKEN